MVALLVGFRVAHFIVQGLLEGLPPRGNGLEGADPVGHTKDVDAGVKGVRMEGEGGSHHETAVRTPDHTDPLAVDPVERFKVFAAPDDVLEVFLAVAPVVHVEEGLAVPR